MTLLERIQTKLPTATQDQLDEALSVLNWQLDDVTPSMEANLAETLGVLYPVEEEVVLTLLERIQSLRPDTTQAQLDKSLSVLEWSSADVAPSMEYEVVAVLKELYGAPQDQLGKTVLGMLQAAPLQAQVSSIHDKVQALLAQRVAKASDTARLAVAMENPNFDSLLVLQAIAEQRQLQADALDTATVDAFFTAVNDDTDRTFDRILGGQTLLALPEGY
jgi:hypothetical protein